MKSSENQPFFQPLAPTTGALPQQARGKSTHNHAQQVLIKTIREVKATMGGSGAKNRRKQQRQKQDEESSNEKVTPAKRTQTTKYSNRRPSHNGKFNGKGPRNSFDGKKKPKEKAFKKPKHLKRKLEGAEDDTTKEKLLHEIQQFETKKSQLSTHSPSKKVKVAQIVDENQSTATKVEEDFPRSNIISEADKVDAAKEEPMEKVDIDKTTTNKNDESSSNVDSDSKIIKVNDGSSSSSSGSDSSDDEEDDQPTRTRGRGRRGRKDTSQQVQEKKAEESSSPKEDKKEDKAKGGNRYCKGRKPVTDFEVGQKYTGTVVYMKPFGVFLDIGCHSDAFCHISRISDDYVEKPEDLFKEGDKVEGVRVIEIDRKTKRLTASLQSEKRLADEYASIEARKERKEKNLTARRQRSKQSEVPSNNQVGTTASNHVKFDTSYKKPKPKPLKIEVSPKPEPPKPSPNASLSTKPESEMTPAELKRARKIARRAARRAEQEAKQ